MPTSSSARSAPTTRSFVGRRPVIVRRLARDARDLKTFTYGVGAYEMLKTATQVFLLLECRRMRRGDQGPRHRRRVVAVRRAGHAGGAETAPVPVPHVGPHSVHRSRAGQRLPRRPRDHRHAPHRRAGLAGPGAVPAGADLVVLARGGHAGAEHQRDRPTLPEHPRAGRPRPARAPGDRSAAAAQQPAVGLHPGRAEPAHGEAPRLRVRPSVRPGALRQGGAAAALGGQPLEVPRGVPPPAAPLLRCSTRRTTTPR